MAAANLVDLINEDKRVLGLALLEGLNDATRQSTNISSAMTLDFGNISLDVKINRKKI